MIVLLIELSTIIIGLYVFWMLLYSMIRGAPYAATTDEKIAIMIKLLHLKKNEKAVDLGAGDGKIVISLAKAGANAFGYEINPWYVALANFYIHQGHVEKYATVYLKSFWGQDLSQYQAITVFGTPHIMRSLAKKIRSQCFPGTRVVSNHFSFPDWKPVKEEEGVILYIV